MHFACTVEGGVASGMPTSRVGGPAPTTARLGRELQRYSQDGERLLAGCDTAVALQVFTCICWAV